MGRGDYHWQHEPCWYAVRNKGQLDRRPQADDAVDHSERRPGRRNAHGTQKPVECMRRPMLNNSNPGQAVYEPFLGSGTTLIAAREPAGGCASAIEIDPLYVDVAVRRWQAFTGEARDTARRWPHVR